MVDERKGGVEPLDALLVGVERPARYTGGELNSVVKDTGVRARIALCFPDLYEIAESYLGFKLLYDVINRVPDLAAERVHAVAPDLEKKLRAAGLPLGSLESRRPLSAFDVVGFTLQYELAYPTILAMLELGGVPLHSAARGTTDPIVLGGGAGTLNPEPIAPFFDAFLLGDGEEAVLEILDAVARARADGLDRAATLAVLALVPGVYVPALFEIEYDGLSVRAIHARPPASEAPPSRHGTPRVARRVLADLDRVKYPERQIQPNVRPVHERFAIEIQRGCSQGCRFCQAGMVQRPTRQRKKESVLAIAETALRESGVDTLGLLSLSAGDYGPLDDLLAALLVRCEPQRVSLSLPSLRTETLTPEVARQVSAVSSTSFTLAPEAGSERLRRVINKTNSEDDLLAAVRAAVGAGARSVKLYFMLGLPTETDEDLDAIVQLALRARTAGRAVRRDMQVTVAVSTFVPKPHTPFQWERQVTVEETRTKQRRLHQQLRARRITMRWHDPEQSFLEGVLARGDRRLAPALEAAMRAGSRLDGWKDHFDAVRWRAALTAGLAPSGLAPEDFLGERDEDRLLPWDHLDSGLLKQFLRRERRRAREEQRTEDCALGGDCYACGACDLGDPYLERSVPDPARVPVVPRVQERPPRAAVPDPVQDVAASLEPTPVLDSAEDGTAPDPTAPRPKPPPPPPRTRVRVRYEKVGRAVHLSQLEAVDHLLRAVRHARMPVIFSEGYTPRPRVSFSPACPTGIESLAELADVLCHGEVDAAPWVAALNARLPQGLRVVAAEVLEPGTPSITEQLAEVHYVATPAPDDAGALQPSVRRFLERSQAPVRVVRKGAPRLYDARRAVQALSVGPYGLHVALAFGMNGALKVTEALAAILGPEVARRCHVCKTSVVFGPGAPPPTVDGDEVGPVLDLVPADGAATHAHGAPVASSGVPFAG